MLDDLKMIHERDAQDALGIAEKQAEQYLYDFALDWTPNRTIHEVVLAGMGGSALAAKAFKITPGLNVPFEVVQDYELPSYVGENTLLICSSYSGNTEETISVLRQALDAERGNPQPMIVVIASGGKLQEIASEHGLPCIQLPGGYQPRHTFGFQYRALAQLFEATPLLDNFLSKLTDAVPFVKDAAARLTVTVPTKENQAKQIAQECIGKSIVIYGGPKMAQAAYKWKISFNENAKQIAWTDQFPEFNHNEFLGWTKQPVDKPYTVIDLRSNLENPRVQKRFEITERLLSGMRPTPIIVQAEGDSALEQLLWTIQLGDFVTLYTALLNGLNPTPVELIEKLKVALND